MGLISLLAPAIPGLINLAERLFTKPKSGDEKMAFVMAALNAALNAAAAQSAVPVKTPTPTADQLQAAIEALLAIQKTK